MTQPRRKRSLADTRVAKAGKMLDLAKTGYDQIREVELMVGVKKEVVKDAQIALDSAKHVLQFTKVRAPFPGVVVKRYRSLGDFVSAGVPILSMYNPDLLYVTANLEETRLRGVAPGNHVELRLDAFDQPFTGRVVWINKSTGAQFALMPRNVVSGEFTKVVQSVPVRIWIEKDDRWPLLRRSVGSGRDITRRRRSSVGRAGGEGNEADRDALQPSGQMIERSRARSKRMSHAANPLTRARLLDNISVRSTANHDVPQPTLRPHRCSNAATGWRPWRSSSSFSRRTRPSCRPSPPTTPCGKASTLMTTT